MSSLDTFSLSSILSAAVITTILLNTFFSLSYVAVITTILFAASKWRNTEADKNACASCGIASGDDVKLEECPECQFVRYCSGKCREDHREQHDEGCSKWAAELHDKKLFSQPNSTDLGDCPICFLPMPLEPDKAMHWICCSKLICMGCVVANTMSNKHHRMKARSCPFCREPAGVKNEEDKDKGINAYEKQEMERVKANDPAALRCKGVKLYQQRNYDAALEYLTKAVELGDLRAHYNLGFMYVTGEGVEKDEKKAVYHLEKAAIDGHPYARNMLGAIELKNGNSERAVKHMIIAAKLGLDLSMKALWDMFKEGYICKQDLEATLRSHQAAIDEMKSSQRDIAEAALQKYSLRDLLDMCMD